MSAPAKTVDDREATAERLLRSSLDHSYEPSIDIDWDAPLVDGKWGLPQHRSSLYGTELWDGLTAEQRRTLTIHEVCSVARIGLWFEMILMQMLLRYAYDRDPRRQHIQYALTEIADECRHSIMFAKMTERYGVPDYAPTRESMRDESVQPLSRMVSRIHVTEEARHVRYAKEELMRIMPRTSRAQLAVGRYLSARIAYVVARNLIQADVYASVGIDPEVGRKAALANPHWQESLRWSARKLVPFLRGQKIIGGRWEFLWRRAYLV